MIKCPNCGSPMPDGSVFCQKCGSRIAGNTMDSHSSHGTPQVHGTESGVLEKIQHAVSRSSVSARPVSGLTGLISAEKNLLIVSSGPSILMIETGNMPAQEAWEDVVKSKFRMGADVAVVLLDAGLSGSLETGLRAQLAKSGIVVMNSADLVEKIPNLNTSDDETAVMQQLMAAIGFTGNGDRMVYSMTETRYTLIPESVKKK
ncbi:MAG: hypothetical protein AMDU1_APLC00099G0006 [Thermoplasmatales archaeon A-plasma]|nr:MAG: hypothetical protein AMDU1_APLC00099G0006 [Thermoplasmatales archaeon A-plasma]